MKYRYQTLALLACLLMANAIGAEMSHANLSPSNPVDAKAIVPQVNYVSPFQNYKSFGETKIAPWKPANDLTQQIGGWRAYLKESNQPEAVEPAIDMQKPAAPKVPQTDPHAGHKH